MSQNETIEYTRTFFTLLPCFGPASRCVDSSRLSCGCQMGRRPGAGTLIVGCLAETGTASEWQSLVSAARGADTPAKNGDPPPPESCGVASWHQRSEAETCLLCGQSRNNVGQVIVFFLPCPVPARRQPAIRPGRKRPAHFSCSLRRCRQADSLSRVDARRQCQQARRSVVPPATWAGTSCQRPKRRRSTPSTAVAGVASTSWPPGDAPWRRSLAWAPAAVRCGGRWSWPGRLRRSSANSTPPAHRV